MLCPNGVENVAYGFDIVGPKVDQFNEQLVYICWVPAINAYCVTYEASSGASIDRWIYKPAGASARRGLLYAQERTLIRAYPRGVTLTYSALPVVSSR